MNADLEPRVRRATPSDAMALASLRYAFRASLAGPIETEAEFVARCAAWMGPRLADESRWRVWLLESGGHTCGTVWLQLIEKVPNPGVERELHAYVTNFFVRTERRRSGAGTRLLSAMISECESLAVDTVFLWPTAESRSIYERHGFTVNDSVMVRSL